MFSSMSSISALRPRRVLPPAVLLLVALLVPAMAAAQGSRSAAATGPSPVAASPVAALSVGSATSTFDELHSRLDDAAERLLAAPASPSVARETAIVGAAESPIASPRQEVRNAPRRALSAARIERLRPVIDPILRGEGIPAELVAVALVESGGQAAALSPKGARGIWQLMPETARRYGLIVSGQRDDRLDMVSATRAAARYLRDLHALFGDWELVLAAYNAGEQAVQSAIQRAGSNSFAVLSQLRLLPAETRNYVPAVMGARGLFKEATAAAEENIAAPHLPTADISGAPAHNFANKKVFYAINAPDLRPSKPTAGLPGVLQIASDRSETQDSTSSITQ